MVILNVFGMPLQCPDEFDWKSLFDDWLELRVVIAKNLGPDDHDFREIDRLCGHLSLRQLFQILASFRPSRYLLYAEWETSEPRKMCRFRRSTPVGTQGRCHLVLSKTLPANPCRNPKTIIHAKVVHSVSVHA